jgi:hypothetical protein
VLDDGIERLEERGITQRRNRIGRPAGFEQLGGPSKRRPDLR